jgi:3-methyladenine DNA glycosylase AlkD
MAPVPSPTTARAVAFVAARLPDAEALGARLAEQIDDPEAFAAALQTGLGRLGDLAYIDGQRRVAPGIGTIHGVRSPLLAAIAVGFRRASRQCRPSSLLFIADRLLREPHLEARWFAFRLLERTLSADPERTWQLLRRSARHAADWITVDDLAHAYAAGIASEPYRWAELEQLVYSPSRWERRLIGSTIATMTHGAVRRGRTPDLAKRGLTLLGQLMGDAEPDVQKALAWAYRSLAELEREATTSALRHEANLAIAASDGHRAWVIRDSLAKLAPAVGDDLRGRLVGIRRRPGAPSTSTAASTAAQFGALPDPAHHPEPALT